MTFIRSLPFHYLWLAVPKYIENITNNMKIMLLSFFSMQLRGFGQNSLSNQVGLFWLVRLRVYFITVIYILIEFDILKKLCVYVRVCIISFHCYTTQISGKRLNELSRSKFSFVHWVFLWVRTRKSDVHDPGGIASYNEWQNINLYMDSTIGLMHPST